MKRTLLVIYLIIIIVSVQAQDTIRYGEDSRYYYYDWDSTSCMDSTNPWSLSSYSGTPLQDLLEGNCIIFAPGTDIYGLSCIQEYLVGGGVTLMLLKYIGGSKYLTIDMLLHDNTAYGTIVSGFNHNPVDTIYQIVDSVHINPGEIPNRYMRLTRSYAESVVVPFYERLFDTVYHVDDSSIYFVTWHGYPEICDNHDGIINENDKIRNPTYYLIDCNMTHINIWLTTFGGSYQNPSRLSFWKKNYYVAAFPIIENPQYCPPVPKPEVSVNRRISTITWSGNPNHCYYEVALGAADSNISTYQRIFVHDTSAIYNLTELDKPYACSIRALCCMDGDSIWSYWSDTVNFIREGISIKSYSNNIHWGYVLGQQMFDVGDTAILTAIPRGEEYGFSHWSNGETSDSLIYVALRDTSFMAYFYQIEDSTGTSDPGDDTTTSEGFMTVDDNGVVLMPNPVTDILNIYMRQECRTSYNAADQIERVEIYDIKGRRIKSLNVNASQYSIDLSDVTSGIYFIRGFTTAGIFTKRICVSRR